MDGQPAVTFAGGEQRPALGLGTCGFGESAARMPHEAAVIGQALETGWRVFDTAEMYADGGAETVLGRALAAALRGGALARSELFVVSKALPQHADESALIAACEASLRRLQIDAIDLYLLHWPAAVPLAETVRGFERLQRRGLVRHWGVSNFDLGALHQLAAVPGGRACAANQVYFSLGARGAGFDLLPWQQAQSMPLIAYSPFDQGELPGHPGLGAIAQRLGATPAQVALAWLLRQHGVMAIPKAGSVQHLRDNWAAQQLRLDAGALAELDRVFPPPRRRQHLAVR